MPSELWWRLARHEAFVYHRNRSRRHDSCDILATYHALGAPAHDDGEILADRPSPELEARHHATERAHPHRDNCTLVVNAEHPTAIFCVACRVSGR
jgi:hypothetical protein